MNILGISCYYHDSAACLVQDGVLVAAAQEERFTRIKHDAEFPQNAIDYCLQEANLSISDIDIVAYYDKPFQKFERILETYLAYAPTGIRSALKAIPIWIKKKLWISELIKDELGYDGEMIFCEHHESHAASAFYPSPYEEAAVLTMDGVGEWATSSWGIGKGNELTLTHEMHFPHSIGLLYSAFTYFAGFKVNSGEYKVMGLAPYGKPIYKDIILKELIDLREDGSFRMNMPYFNYCQGLTMTSRKMNKLFGGPPRKPESKITQREMDLAASVQAVVEEIMLRMAKHVRKETGMKYLCLAGGVALNCVGNGKLLRERIFDDIWIQPAAGDAGNALGAAMFAWHQYLEKPRKVNADGDSMFGSYLGPEFSDDEIKKALEKKEAAFHHIGDEKLFDEIAKLIDEGNVIGWFQGRMEFGPRALGNRSILGDPRSPEMQKTINLKIKFREGFRPFAPSVMEEHISEYFEIDRPSPYMLLVADVVSDKLKNVEEKADGFDKLNQVRSELPAITHVDNSARIQSVSSKTNPRYHALISAFYKRTGCPVVINTSFNVRGEPIVRTPEDAWRCFMRTNMDVLVVGNYVLYKGEQKPLDEDSSWKEEFELD